MKHTRFEAAVLLIAFGIIAYQIFLPPLIGLADSWDFERLLRQNGLAHVPTGYEDKYFLYFNSKYRIISRTIESAPQSLYAYKSSTSLPMRTARWLSMTAGQDEILDIRVLAALYTVLLLFGLWLVLKAARLLSTGLWVLLSGLLILIFTDVGYVSYFNSFYSEGTGLVFLAIGIGSSLILITQRSPNVLALVGYFLAFLMVVTTKTMYAFLAPAFALFGIYLSGYVRFRWRYWLSSSLGVALCCIATWYYYQTPAVMGVQAAYVGVFMDLLPHSSNPRQDLSELGLNPNYTLFIGTTPYQPDSPLNTPEFQNEFTARVKSHTLALFYLTHPDRLYELCARCMKQAFTTRVSRLGYYEANTGKPPRSRAFGLWSVIRENVFPRSVFFLGFFFATGIAAVVFLIKSSSRTLRGVYLLYLLFVSIAGAQFFVAVVAGGGEPDLEKHLFMFNLAFDACIVLFVIGIVYSLQTYKVSFPSRFRRFKTELAPAGLSPSDQASTTIGNSDITRHSRLSRSLAKHIRLAVTLMPIESKFFHNYVLRSFSDLAVYAPQILAYYSKHEHLRSAQEKHRHHQRGPSPFPDP